MQTTLNSLHSLAMVNTLPKSERLCSKKLFDQLFSQSESLAKYPIRLVWTETALPETDGPVQVAFTVPKRKFKRAVDRNRLKRLMREAYRTNKMRLHTVLRSRQKQIALLILYTGKDGADFVEIREKIILTLNRLIERYESGV